MISLLAKRPLVLANRLFSDHSVCLCDLQLVFLLSEYNILCMCFNTHYTCLKLKKKSLLDKQNSTHFEFEQVFV